MQPGRLVACLKYLRFFSWRFLEDLQEHMECTQKTWKLQNFHNFLLALCKYCIEEGFFWPECSECHKNLLVCIFIKHCIKFYSHRQNEEREGRSMIWQNVKGVALEVLWTSPQATIPLSIFIVPWAKVLTFYEACVNKFKNHEIHSHCLRFWRTSIQWQDCLARSINYLPQE